jgi:hypothetical protein
MIIAWGFPFDWLIMNYDEKQYVPPVEDRLYPCDSEELNNDDSKPVLLSVNSLYHVYPDGK